MTASAKGVVYLVGAGPGDPGLITLRALELLRIAEVLVYDHLADRSFLHEVPRDCEVCYVGKEASRHSLPQDQIQRLLVEKALAGKIVVRLKGGDPFVFGRGGEEAECLAAAGIPFEVVPGVSAGIAVCAYAGIAVTHRDFASELIFVTGHEAEDRSGESAIDWNLLARWKGTLVFYMGVKNAPAICRRLRENGMSDSTPAAMIMWGTTPRQKTVVGTLADLPEKAAASNMAPPALRVFGQVVRLRETLKWFENRPLFGKTIVVTRSREQSSELVQQLTALGANTVEFPTIRIEPLEDPQQLRNAAIQIRHYRWVIFTSTNGVDAFFRELDHAGYDARHLGGVKVCAIGPMTARRLQICGIAPDLIPQKYVAEEIVTAISHADDLTGSRILLPRADIARPDLAERLEDLGAQVEEVIAYRTKPETRALPPRLDSIRSQSVDWITFTSSSTVRNFLQLIPAEELKAHAIRLASIGPITSQTLRQAGMEPTIEADEFTIPGLVRKLVEYAVSSSDAKSARI